jgi:hypothetical protein
MLDVTPPELVYEGRETGLATLEKPVDVLVGSVMWDGGVVEPADLATFAYFVYRRSSSGSALDIWDDDTKAWTSEQATGIDRKPIPLGYQANGPTPWRGVIVGAGGRDASGQPQFERAVRGYPLYSVRAYFVTADRSEALLTGPSDNLAFIGTADRNLMVIGPGEGEQLDAATEARLVLKGSGLQTLGRLRIQRDTPGAVVTLENAAGASIVLHADGRVEVTPAPGHRVVVAGDLETERITYLPAGGAVKQTLT